jgi:hypothetical protein
MTTYDPDIPGAGPRRAAPGSSGSSVAPMALDCAVLAGGAVRLGDPVTLL